MKVFKILSIIFLNFASFACIPVGQDSHQEPIQNTTDNPKEQQPSQLATMHVRVQELEEEMNQLKGQIDTLQEAFKTGKMPGQPDDESSDNSLSTRVNDLEVALEEVRRKVGITSGSLNSISTENNYANTDHQVAKNISELRFFFQDKKYQAVISNADNLSKTATKTQKSEIEFMKGQSSFHLGDYTNAALQLDQFVKSKPRSKDDLAQAKLYLGDCFKKLGDHKTAKIYYSDVKNNYKNSKFASQARQRLTGI